MMFNCKNFSRLSLPFLSLTLITLFAPAGALADSFEIFKVEQHRTEGFLVNHTRRSYQWVAPSCIVKNNLKPRVFPHNTYLDKFSKWSTVGQDGKPLDKWKTCQEVTAVLNQPTLGNPIQPPSPAHLLVFTNAKGQKTPYFVYLGKKQYISKTCRVEHSSLDPFGKTQLKVHYTSNWNGVANIPPVGGVDRSFSERLSCQRMASLITTQNFPEKTAAKLMRYQNSKDTSLYFSSKGYKQWIGSDAGRGVSCRRELEGLLKNSFLPTARTWKEANSIGGPDRSNKLSCDTMVKIAKGNSVFTINPTTTTQPRSTTTTTRPRSTTTTTTRPRSTTTTTIPNRSDDEYFPLPNSGAEVDRRSPLGVNLASETYWSSAWTFVDAMHKAGHWSTNSGKLELDAQGWVKRLNAGQTANVTAFRNVQGNYPAGRYTVLYAGEGTLRYGRGARLVQSTRKKGFEQIQVDPLNGRLDITLVSTNPSNHLRNLRVILPGGSCERNKAKMCGGNSDCGDAGRCLPFTETYQERLFHPNFLRNLTGFPVIRFMEWGAANYAKLSGFKDFRANPAIPSPRTWGNRILPRNFPWQAYFHEGREVPYEVMIRLANDIKADAWINIPHGVNNNYVRELARFFKARIEGGRKVYVELSNEMWNYGFKQGTMLSNSMGKIGTMEATFDRSVEMFKIFQREFGGTSQLVRVIAPQAGNPGAGRHLMKRAEAKGQLAYIDAIAIAPYFGHEWICKKNDQFARKSVDTIINELQNGGMHVAVGRMQEYGKIAREFGKKLIAYEGGQHFALPGTPAARNCADPTVNKDVQKWVQKIYQLNNHKGMRQVYNTYLQEWRKAGGDLFVLYNYTGVWSQHGTWSFFETNQGGVTGTSPKFQGTMDFRRNNPKWW